jgi:hypothetical protein
MANLAKKIAFTHEGSLKETPLDKTTRIVRRITDNEADVRHEKTARLRKARFEKEAEEAVETVATAPSGTRTRR